MYNVFMIENTLNVLHFIQWLYLKKNKHNLILIYTRKHIMNRNFKTTFNIHNSFASFILPSQQIKVNTSNVSSANLSDSALQVKGE